jgi:hypothetical protein
LYRLLLAGLLALPAAGHAESSIYSNISYAYAANAGWINFYGDGAHGVRVGEAFLSGYAYGANFGWINFGDGSPDNGFSYSNTSATDFGVNHDGNGNLSGYAYGANIGWINFEWTSDPADPNRPRLDLATGIFYGYVYAANIGWIFLHPVYLRAEFIAYNDSDNDGMDDAWEMKWFGNLAEAGVATDHDRDGQSDASEYGSDTDPLDPEDYLKIIAHSYADGMTTTTITFTTRPSRWYLIQASTDLVNWWECSGLSYFPPDAGTTTTKTFSLPGAARRFFRVGSTPPLQKF